MWHWGRVTWVWVEATWGSPPFLKAGLTWAIHTMLRVQIRACWITTLPSPYGLWVVLHSFTWRALRAIYDHALGRCETNECHSLCSNKCIECEFWSLLLFFFLLLHVAWFLVNRIYRRRNVAERSSEKGEDRLGNRWPGIPSLLLCVEEAGTSFTKLVSKYSLYKMGSFFMIDIDYIFWSHLHVLFCLFYLLSSLSFRILYIQLSFF